MRQRDIARMWAQIVQRTGVNKYTSEEWQNNFEKFCLCMKPNTNPYIRIERIDNVLTDRVTRSGKMYLTDLANQSEKRKTTVVAKKSQKSVSCNSEMEMGNKGTNNKMSVSDDTVLSPNTETQIEEKMTSTKDMKNKMKSGIENHKSVQTMKKKIADSRILQTKEAKETRLKQVLKPEEQSLNRASAECQLKKQKLQLEQKENSQKEERPLHKPKKKTNLEAETSKAQPAQQAKHEENVKEACKLETNGGERSQTNQKQKEDTLNSSSFKIIANDNNEMELQDSERNELQKNEKQKVQENKTCSISRKNINQKTFNKSGSKIMPSKSHKSNKIVVKLKKIIKDPGVSVWTRVGKRKATTVKKSSTKNVNVIKMAKKDLVPNRPQHPVCLRVERDQQNKRQQKSTEEQQHMNAKSEHEKSTCQANSMPSEIAKKPPKSINIPPATKEVLYDVSVPDAEGNPDLHFTLPEEQRLSLSVTRKAIAADCEESALTDSNINYELEDERIMEAILAAPVGHWTDESKSDASTSAEQTYSGIEKLANKLQKKIDNQIAETVNSNGKIPISPSTFDKTPLEAEASLNNVLNYDDDDCDAISVATSWDGDDHSVLTTGINESKEIDSQDTIIMHTENVEERSGLRYGMDKSGVFTKPPIPQPRESPDQKTIAPQQPDICNSLEIQQSDNPIQKTIPFQQADSSNSIVNQQATPVFGIRNQLAIAPSNAQPIDPNVLSYKPLFSILGIKCWSYLDGTCNEINCDHTLRVPFEVQRDLDQLETDKLCEIYCMILRHGILFRSYFAVFIRIFCKRGMIPHLMNMVNDCCLYVKQCHPFITDIYYSLLSFGLLPQVVTAHFIKCLWSPNIGNSCPELVMQLLRILSVSDWFNYLTHLQDLFHTQAFPMPVEFMSCLANSAIERNDQKLVQKVVELVLYSPIARNNDTIRTVIQIVQKWSNP